uniref:Ubiquitin-like protease family profile domain-containing protein n=1 Tax=Chenopodium quinoa TaxID=63459 RepID=A0A803MAR5_CHEQI
MSELMNKLQHPKAEDIMSYEFDNVSFPWKSTKQTLDCGVFCMLHMLCFNGELFNGDLGLANRRKLYRAKICASLVLSDINSNIDAIVDKVSKFKEALIVCLRANEERGVTQLQKTWEEWTKLKHWTWMQLNVGFGHDVGGEGHGVCYSVAIHPPLMMGKVGEDKEG